MYFGSGIIFLCCVSLYSRFGLHRHFCWAPTLSSPAIALLSRSAQITVSFAPRGLPLLCPEGSFKPGYFRSTGQRQCLPQHPRSVPRSRFPLVLSPSQHRLAYTRLFLFSWCSFLLPAVPSKGTESCFSSLCCNPCAWAAGTKPLVSGSASASAAGGGGQRNFSLCHEATCVLSSWNGSCSFGEAEGPCATGHGCAICVICRCHRSPLSPSNCLRFTHLVALQCALLAIDANRSFWTELNESWSKLTLQLVSATWEDRVPKRYKRLPIFKTTCIRNPPDKDEMDINWPSGFIVANCNNNNKEKSLKTYWICLGPLVGDCLSY